jgi:two-component system, LytTR family, sensor kinase
LPRSLNSFLKWLTQPPKLYQLIGWVLTFFLILLIVISLVSFSTALIFSIILEISMIFVFYLNSEVLIGRYFETKQWTKYILISLSVFILVIIVRYFIVQQLNITSTFRPVFTPEIRLISFPILMTLSTFIFSTFYKLFLNSYEKETQHLAIINEQKEAQLQFLRGQINPHFLFNTLNNIYALATVKSDNAPIMILRLSELLRYVIYDSQAERVYLNKEIDQIHRFIELFQMRFREQVKIDFIVDGSLEDTMIEPMVLIPLVENCFKHCNFDSDNKAFIIILVKIEQGKLTFETQNTFSKANTQKDKVGGVGLENIRKRLDLKYQSNYSLETEIVEQIFKIKLSINL